jgi:hypothetical protein
MLQRKELESKVFGLIEFVETVIVQYISILIGTLIRPKETIRKIRFSEKVSPLLLLIINVVIAALIEDATDSNSLLGILLKSLILTTKPTWNDKLWSILGLLLGSFLLVLVIRTVSRVLTGKKIVLSMATKSICYGSFTFAPIVIAKFVFTNIFFAAFYDIYNNVKQYPIASSIIVTMLALSIYLWWSMIVLLWLNSYLPNIQRPKAILAYSLIAFFILKGVAYNFDSLEKIQTMSKLTGSARYVMKSLEKSPPDYISAAAAQMLLSDTEDFSPYRRYSEKIKAMTYFANGIAIFDFNNAVIALKQSKYELLEKYFSDAIPKANKSTLTISQQRQLEFMEKLLSDAKKEKTKDGFSARKYEISIAFIKFPFFDTSNKYMRFLP